MFCVVHNQQRCFPNKFSPLLYRLVMTFKKRWSLLPLEHGWPLTCPDEQNGGTSSGVRWEGATQVRPQAGIRTLLSSRQKAPTQASRHTERKNHPLSPANTQCHKEQHVNYFVMHLRFRMVLWAATVEQNHRYGHMWPAPTNVNNLFFF